MFFLFIYLDSILRASNFYDWGTYLMMLCFLLFVFIFSFQSQRMLTLLNLPISDKYLRIFDEQPLNSAFNSVALFLKLVSFSFIIFFSYLRFNNITDFNFKLYLQIFTVVSVFLVSKILIEKIIFNIFEVENLFNKLQYNRFSYSNVMGILFLPLHFIIFYNFNLPNVFFYFYFGIIIFGLLFNYFLSILHFFNLLIKHNIYFILYICTLEIAPLVYIYHLVKKFSNI